MAVNYIDCKPDENGKYGPTDKSGLYYKPNPVHNPKAKKVEHKTRWRFEPPGQFCVFNDAVSNDRYVKGKGFLGIDIRDNLRPAELGENGEVLAVFHQVANPNEPWHGNPEKANRLNNVYDDIIETMKRAKLINKSSAKKILTGKECNH